MNDENLLIPTQVIKSKRKTISLIINNNGDFIVRAPIKCSDNKIIDFINEKSSWIIKKRTEQRYRKVNPIDFEKSDITILDKKYSFSFYDKKSVTLKDNIIYLPKDKYELAFVSYLKKLAKIYLQERTKDLANKYGFNYTSISISSAKTCWGSCSGNNKLHFTYKLLMCPKEVIDYVILHELCHTKIKNHSDKFWILVKSCNPNYKTHEKWLKENRAIVELI